MYTMDYKLMLETMIVDHLYIATDLYIVDEKDILKNRSKCFSIRLGSLYR